MDGAQWSQEIGVATNTCNSQMLKRKVKPREQLNCPRCNSTNTKFCYYNNYSLTQPRYFCKTCRRYWTEGGSLRNVPVGGGSGKNKRHVSSSTKIPDLNPPKTLQGQDLNLAFHINASHHQVTKLENNNNINSSSPSFLRTGTSTSSRGMNLNSFTPISMPLILENSSTMYPSGFPLQEFKPTLNFSLDFLGSRYNEAQENSGRLFFPSGEFKQLSNATEVDRNKGQGNSSGGYWSGMLGGGSW